uniref:Uncharacterized protein n=1 Tax=Rhizophora mucronata TaxID=61149 RepID=A0A2P2PMJ7_RHIMU
MKFSQDFSFDVKKNQQGKKRSIDSLKS